MSSIEDAIRLHNSIAEQFSVRNAVSAFINNSGAAAYLNAVNEFKQNLHLQPAFLEFQQEMKGFYRAQESVFQGISAFHNMIQPVLQEYQVVAGITNFVNQVQASMQPIRSCLQSIQPILQESQVFAQLTEIRNQVMLNPSLLTGSQQALEEQIDASVWEVEAEQDTWEQTIEEEMCEEILSLTECDDKAGAINQFLAKWGEKGKKLLIELVKWLTTALLSGWIAYGCESVYKVITPTICLEEENLETAERTEIPVNTEIHVWNEITNNFIEVTYKVDDVEHQGYITQEELNTNTELISGEVELEHIVFINNVTNLLAARWEMDPEQVYAFLKDDADLINGYLLKHYDVLSLLDEDGFMETLEAYCAKEGIELPKEEEKPELALNQE